MNARSGRRARANGATSDRFRVTDWDFISGQLLERGYAMTGALLDSDECSEIAAFYDREGLFRSRIVMNQRNFGRGEYKYFAYPLPAIVAGLREAFYPPLASVANRWTEMLANAPAYPPTLAAYLARCHKAGQTRPTPLLLKYGAGDYNRLHQDLYGDLVFPLQMTILLSRPRKDFDGGQFVLTEQRPRMQSRAEVVPLLQGEAVIFAVHHRPVSAARGYSRATMRHGVSTLTRGNRMTLGIIFHDAR